MNDMEKFLAEWETRFPQEELPDAGFITSVNFVNIRSKIAESESKIKGLRLALEKEEFILNWLISLDIEISVSGNVGTMNDGTTCGPNSTPIWMEGERSPNNSNPPNDQAKILSVEEKREGSQVDQGYCDDVDTDQVKKSSEKAHNDKENDMKICAPDETGNCNMKDGISSADTPAQSENRASELRPIDLSLKTNAEEVESSDEPEYENVFDLLGVQSSDAVTPDSESPTRKGKDKRRAGGSWSLYVDEKKDENHKKVENEEQFLYDTIPNNHETKIETVPLKPKRGRGHETVNVYEEIHFPDERENNEDLKNNDNITINQLYEPVELEFKKETINTEEEEEGGEAIYVNVRELNIPNKMAPVARIEASDASDYDSDGGKNDEKMQCYRPMTEDEINNLRRWRSDEDISQINQDLGK